MNPKAILAFFGFRVQTVLWSFCWLGSHFSSCLLHSKNHQVTMLHYFRHKCVNVQDDFSNINSTFIFSCVHVLFSFFFLCFATLTRHHKQQDCMK